MEQFASNDDSYVANNYASRNVKGTEWIYYKGTVAKYTYVAM